MAVDLSELIDSLKREVGTPGNEDSTFPDALDADWLGHLQDGFWQARLDGMLEGYQETDGVVTPVASSAADLTRDLQQLVVLYAGIRIVTNQLRGIQTLFRAKAGAVEYETQQSAQVLKEILQELHRRRAVALERLSDLGQAETYYVDAVAERDWQISAQGLDWWGS